MGSRKTKGEILFDRRRASRIPSEFKALITTGNETQTAWTRNLTPHGAMFALSSPIPLLEILEIEIELEDGFDPIQVSGRIAREAESDGVDLGPVEFDVLEASDAERILRATRKS